MSLSEKLENISNNNLIIAENQEKVYKAGQSSMVDESKIIEKTVSGEYISVDDVSEIPHEVKVKLTSGGKNLWTNGDQTFTKYVLNLPVELKAGVTYTFSALVTSSDTDNSTCLVWDTEGNKRIGGLYRDIRSSIIFTPTTDIYKINLYASNSSANSEGDTATYKDIMLEQISGENLFDINDSTIEKKRRLSANAGTSWSNSADGSDNFNVSHYIPVDGGNNYTAYNTNTGSSWYCWYDKDKVYISGGGTTAGKILTAPSNACYFRFDYPSTDTNVTFCELFEPSDYEPYKETLTDYSGVSLTRCGKNLWYPYSKITKITKDGVTLVKNDDNTFTVNGTATATTFFHIGHIPIIYGEEYWLYGGNANYKVSFQLREGGQSKDTKRVNNESVLVGVPSIYIDNLNAVIQVDSGTTLENEIFKPMITTRRNNEFEPYNEQTLTANADGTVEGVEYISPYMYMNTDNPNVTINATYHKSYGMQTERDRFWDRYIKAANGNYGYRFAGGSWTEELLKTIPYPLHIYNAPGMFYYNSAVTDLSNFPLENGVFKITNFEAVFREAVNLKKTFLIDGSAMTTGGSDCFANCRRLVSVYFIENSIIGNFVFSSCTLLNKESILNIFAGLSGSVTSKTLTLSTTAVNNAFETSTGAADGSTSTEWTNLVATKTNWTISLV